MNDEFGFHGQNQQPTYQQPPASEQPAAGTQPPAGGQPQYGGYGYGQQQSYTGGYAPSMGGYTPPPSTPAGRTGRGGGWIMLLRVFLWLLFSAICLVGVILCMQFFHEASRYNSSECILAGLGCLIGCVFLAFVTVAGGMIALDAAQNIRRCAINSSNILNLLNQQQYKN